MTAEQQEQKPSKEFTYPKGRPMCESGKVRASYWGQQILTGKSSVDEIEPLAKRAQTDEHKGADTSKKNLIAKIVYRHAKTGDLDEFITEDGDFIDRGKIKNLKDDRYKNLLAGMFGKKTDNSEE